MAKLSKSLFIALDRKVSGEALFKEEIPEGPLPGYEKEFREHVEKNPQ
jgi:hypothetical protein